MKYKVNDRVVIKPWKLMEAEYGLDDNGNIATVCQFMRTSDDLLSGTGRVVAIREVQQACYFTSPSLSFSINDAHILGYAFDYGQEIEVSDDGKKWYKHTFGGYIPGWITCVKTLDSKCGYKHARPIQAPVIDVTVTRNGEKLTPEQIKDLFSAETWENFRKGE